MSFGNTRNAWNDQVKEHYAPTLSACVSEAPTDNVIIACRPRIHPSLDVTIPLCPDVILTDVPSDKHADLVAEQ